MAKKRVALFDALAGLTRAIGRTTKSFTKSGRKKAAPKKPTKTPTAKKKARKPAAPRKKGANKPKATQPKKRTVAKPFLKKLSTKERKRIAKRGVKPLTPKQRKEYLGLRRQVLAKRKLTAEDRRKWDRLSKQVFENKVAAADQASVNKKNSRRSKSKPSGRKNRVLSTKKATLSKATRKGKRSKK